MPITPEHAGRTYAATVPYEITQVKVAEFSRALGVPRDVSDATTDAPPTFAAVVVSPAWDLLFDDPELGLGPIVHADQQLRWRRPLRVGDVVTATLRVDKVRARGEADFISTVIEVRDETDAVVLEAGATFFHSRAGAA